ALKIRLQQLQDDAYTNASILTEHPVFSSKELHTYTAQAILVMHQNQIQIERTANPWPLPLKINKPNTRFTNIKRSTLKAFIIKLITNEVPNYVNLYLRNKEKNTNYSCARCNTEVEDTPH
ncbi:13503_t:CDS:2, partial [Racocetra fulgida]